MDRDQRLRALDETGAQSVRQKIDLERSKSAIEIEYLNKTLDVRRQLFDDATNREAIELRRIYESTGLDPKETARRLAAFETAKDQERENLGTSNKAAIDTVRANAQQRSEDIQRDAALRQFESFKQSANGILDSLFSRTRTLGQLVGDFFKTAVLTPLKEIASSQIAKALFEGLNPGQHVTFDASKGSGKFSGISSVLNGFGLGGASVRGVPGIGGTSVNQTVTPFDGSQASGYGTGGAVSIFGGAQNIATRLLTGQSALFLDGQEAIGAGENTGGYPTLPSGLIDRTGGYSSSLDPTGLIGGPGGTSGFSGSVSLGGGTATPSSGGGILSRLGGLFGGRQQTSGGSVAIAGESTGALSNLAGLFGFGGGAGGTYGSGVIGTGLTGGLKAFAGSTGGALVGAGLAYDGLKRGGIAGTAETTAGGALLGYKFGGGFGAVIGAGIGLGAGIIRSLFFSSDADQVKKQVKDLYQLSISTNIANQIVQTAKQSYGGSFSVAIRSKPVLDLLSLYAQSTGQNFFFQNTPKPAYLTESGGDIFQQATYVNGKAYSFAGGLPVANGIPTSTIPSYVVGQQTSRVNGVDYTTPTFGGSGGMSIQLDGPATTALLQGQIVSNPRLVASANAQAQNGNFDRRQQAARVLSPSLIFG